MDKSANIIRIIQLSDCHLQENTESLMHGCNTYSLFKQTITHLMHQHDNSDILLLSGDLSQDESVQSYQILQETIKPLTIPAYALAGNHDHPQNMQVIFDGATISTHKSIMAGAWQILLLNSAVANKSSGYITKEELSWLETQLLKNPHTPTLLVLHHPLLEVGSRWMDALGTQNSAEILQLIDQHKQIEIVLFGHIHQEFSAERNGVYYLGSPSTCFQYKPASDEFMLDDLSPGYRWLELLADGSFNTGIERIVM